MSSIVLGSRCPVVSNVPIIADHRVVTCVAPEIAAAARPGHFVNILAGDSTDPFLRKPFSIYTVDRELGQISVLYSIVGAVTKMMARKRVGDDLDLVGPLGGRIFTPDPRPGVTHIMAGGGYGVPPLVFLAREILKTPTARLRPGHDATALSAPPPTGKVVVFLIGARRADLLLCEAELVAAGIDTRVTTEDGSRGIRGRITDGLAPILENDGDGPYAVYCCGPTPMMHAVGDLCSRMSVPCQVSVEVAMPCGVGVCMACVIDTTDGRRVRCCTEGPVFDAGEVAW
jgi:dihydroorotate dehydrogenase electron transfer subunit